MRVSLTLTTSYRSALTENQNKLNLVTGQAEIADRMNPWPIGVASPNVHLGNAHILPVRHTAVARRLAAQMAGKPIRKKPNRLQADR